MKTCQDEVIAVIHIKNNTAVIRRPKNYHTTFIGLEAFSTYQHHYQKPIVIVTESPHIEEFRVNGITDILTGAPVNSRPVNGASGQNIIQHMIHLLAATGLSLPDGMYPVILVNALQEQCSEGQDTLLFRTKNFLRLWHSQKNFLETRLKSLQPLFVLCSCTVGDFRLSNGENAYCSGKRRDFEQHFNTLLTQEFNLTRVNQSSVYCFMGSLDLSGLVLDVIHHIFSPLHIHIYKTSHPAAWRYGPPALRQYSKVEYCYDFTPPEIG